MNKCRHCGAFVPVEKAFCPNCSEPIEPEEAPNRAASASSDMMATMRDDPETYKELLASLKDKKSGAGEAPPPDSGPAHTASPANIGHSFPQMMPDATAPPLKSNKRGLALIIGAISILIILVVILLTLKVI